MLEIYARVGAGLYRLRAVLITGMVAGFVLFVAGLFAPTSEFAESRTLLPALACLACLCMFVFAHAFRGAMPAVDENAGLWRRIAVRTQRMFLHLLALIMIALGAATLLLILRGFIIVRAEWLG
ncbi:MAG: putative membrane protein [Gammaproteobacteria bacterium]